MNLRSILLWQLEKLGSKVISTVFWPPAKVSNVVIKEDKVLAVDAGSYLMLPGGLVDSWESFEDAARRELEEETGLEATELERVEEKTHHLPGIEAVFRTDAEGELSGSWEGEPVWIPVDEVGNYRWRFDRNMEKLLEKCRKTS